MDPPPPNPNPTQKSTYLGEEALRASCALWKSSRDLFPLQFNTSSPVLVGQEVQWLCFEQERMAVMNRKINHSLQYLTVHCIKATILKQKQQENLSHILMSTLAQTIHTNICERLRKRECFCAEILKLKGNQKSQHLSVYAKL